MKRLLVFAIVLCSAASTNAALTLEEIRTASNNVLVAYFKSTTIKPDEVNTTDLTSWKLNGQPVTAINKFVTEADACDHHIYLQVPALVNFPQPSSRCWRRAANGTRPRIRSRCLRSESVERHGTSGRQQA